MDYGGIVNDSFRIAWRYKSLWFFGLFAGGGMTGFNINTDLGDIEVPEFGIGSLELPSLGDVLVPLLIAVGMLALAYLMLHLISVPALIDAVNKIKRGGVYRFSDSFSVGIDCFLRFFGLFLLFTFAGLICVGFAVGLVVGLGIVHIALGVLIGIALVPFGLAFIFLMTNLLALSQRVIAVRDVGIGDALEEAYLLFRRNLSRNFVVFLIYIGLSIAIGIAALIIWFIVGMPIAALALATGAGVVPALLMALVMGLPVSIVIGGFTGTALSNLYTLFYFELVEPSGSPTIAPVRTEPAS